MASIYQTFDTVIPHTPSSAVAAGDVVTVGNLIGVATHPIAANVLGSLTVAGIVRIAKATGASSGIAAGTQVYWDDVNGVVTATAGSLKKIGTTATASTDADTEALVILGRNI